MTLEEFDKTRWSAGMKMTYKDTEYDISSVNFEEKLVAFSTPFDDDLSWVRCENIYLIV